MCKETGNAEKYFFLLNATEKGGLFTSVVIHTKGALFVDVVCDTMLLLTKATETQLFPHTDLFSYFDASGMKFNASTKSEAAKESIKCL